MREEQSNMSELFSPFGSWTEQYVKVKRGNESEWGDCIKVEIGIVHVIVCSISSLHLLCMDGTWPSAGTYLTFVNYNFATITHLLCYPETVKMCFLFLKSE